MKGTMEYGPYLLGFIFTVIFAVLAEPNGATGPVGFAAPIRQEKPKISIPGPEYFAVYGDQITLPCLVRDAQYVSWAIITNGQEKPIDSRNYVGGTLTQPNLTIHHVFSADEGTYICTAANQYGSQSARTTLTIGEKPKVSIPGPEYFAVYGDQITLPCLVKDAQSVSWTIITNGQEKPIDSRNYVGGTLTHPNLTIHHVFSADGGTYICTAANQFGSQSARTNLTIGDLPNVSTNNETYGEVAPPVFKRFPSTTIAEVGSRIELRVDIETYPSILYVEWRHNDRKLTGGRYEYGTANPSLVINNVRVDDDGNYTCTVKNGVGMTSQTMSLTTWNHEQSSLYGAIAGGVFGLFVAGILMVLLIITIKRLRPESTPTETNSRTGRNRHVHDQFVQDSKGGGVLTNIKRNAGKSNTDASCYNVEDFTTIKVTDLGGYIRQQQKNGSLNKQFKDIPSGVQFPVKKSQMKENKPKNRYKTILPYDHTRVVLESYSTDYINASYIDGFEKKKCYIACQGPLKSTLNDNWKMIWQENVKKIVMLTNLEENEMSKCDKYWPSGGETLRCGDFELVLLSEKERSAYTTREISVENTKTKEKREVIQYHFTAWPDYGATDHLYLALFHKHVMSGQRNNNSGPILVNCSAGIGRTGTFIGLDALYEEGMKTQSLNVFKYVNKMRNCRMNMVQTEEQYVFLHSALLELFTSKDTAVGKEEFGKVWNDIKDGKGPVNHQHLKQEFKMLQDKMKEHEPLRYAEATRESNIKKNKNQLVMASDSTRTILTSFGKGSTDYINAVHSPSYTKFVGYLITQLPLPDTMVDFWTMISDHRSSTIVLLLNDEKEADMVYASSSEVLRRGSFVIQVTKTVSCENSITEKTVSVSRKNANTRTVNIYQCVFKDYPDKASLKTMVNLMSTRIDNQCEASRQF